MTGAGPSRPLPPAPEICLTDPTAARWAAVVDEEKGAHSSSSAATRPLRVWFGHGSERSARPGEGRAEVQGQHP